MGDGIIGIDDGLALTTSSDFDVAGGSKKLAGRITASLKNPTLIGKSGYRQRYLKVQWWVVFWRLLILVQIPEVALVYPARFTSLPKAFLLLGLGAAYALLYGYLASRTRFSGTGVLHLADLCVCSIMMLISFDEKLIFIMMFYSYSSLLARPTVLLREAVPATVVLSLAYLAASASIGHSLLDIWGHSGELRGFILYYFWGLGFIGFSAVLQRASALELDIHLDEQRRKYRRQLHDDLGNSFFALHLTIGFLRSAKSKQELLEAVSFLHKGYERTARMLRSVLGGPEGLPEGDLERSLHGLGRELEAETLMPVSVEITAAGANLTSEAIREIVSLVREAVMNAVKHAQADRVAIAVAQKGPSLLVSITDNGRGFDQRLLRHREAAGSSGMRGMKERAKQLQGELTISSGLGFGTTVTLIIKQKRRSVFFKNLLHYDAGKSHGGVFPFLIRLRAAMFIWVVAQLVIDWRKYQLSAALLLIIAFLTLNCLLWLAFSNSLYELFSRRPWLILLENFWFALLIHSCLLYQVPLFFLLYVGVAIIMDGLFLGPWKNVLFAGLINLGVFWAFGNASAAMEVAASVRFERAFQHIIIFTILAVSSGLAGDFVKNLEGLQRQTLSRALLRQKERLMVEIHRNLQDLVLGLKEEIIALKGNLTDASGRGYDQAVERLEQRSADINQQLRQIYDKLENFGEASLEAKG